MAYIVHSFNEYLLSAYYELGTILGPGESTVVKTQIS